MRVLASVPDIIGDLRKTIGRFWRVVVFPYTVCRHGVRGRFFDTVYRHGVRGRFSIPFIVVAYTVVFLTVRRDAHGCFFGIIPIPCGPIPLRAPRFPAPRFPAPMSQTKKRGS